MTEITHRHIETNGIRMHIAEAGEGRPIILCHGFPELWYSYRRIIPGLAEAGYHAIAFDQRGYGQTDVPTELTDYDMPHLIGDLVGLLDALGEEKAIFIAHDWGAIVLWQFLLQHPERVEGAVSVSVPFTPRGEMSTISLLRLLAEDKFMYMLYFQEPGLADEELARDTHDTFRRVMWSLSGDAAADDQPPAFGGGPGFLDGRKGPDELPEWLTQEDIDYFASEFKRTGFTGVLNWYRNWDRNWEISADTTGAHVTVPTLFITGDRDPVRGLLPESTMDGWLDDHRGNVIIPGAGHWEEQEKPSEVLAAILPFIEQLPPH
ncbi:MAG: alpha/beta hydrolase [Candidatus Dormibacteraeota bacterium]|nr:alpha/beta hydrolase [Candidatus Dormibacteraeota bacterium]